jgi:hypothetical protein
MNEQKAQHLGESAGVLFYVVVRRQREIELIRHTTNIQIYINLAGLLLFGFSANKRDRI